MQVCKCSRRQQRPEAVLLITFPNAEELQYREVARRGATVSPDMLAFGMQ